MTCNHLAWHKLLYYRGEHMLKIWLRSVDSEKLPELTFKKKHVVNVLFLFLWSVTMGVFFRARHFTLLIKPVCFLNWACAVKPINGFWVLIFLESHFKFCWFVLLTDLYHHPFAFAQRSTHVQTHAIIFWIVIFFRWAIVIFPGSPSWLTSATII